MKTKIKSNTTTKSYFRTDYIKNLTSIIQLVVKQCGLIVHKDKSLI
jgi:hypothetical protein